MKEAKSMVIALSIAFLFIILAYGNNYITGGAIKSYSKDIPIEIDGKKVSVFCDDDRVYGNSFACRRAFKLANYIGAKCPSGTVVAIGAGDKCFGEGRCPPVNQKLDIPNSGLCVCQYMCV